MGTFRGGATPDWYVRAFDLSTTDMPWSDTIVADVDRVLKILDPPPGARILDLACGVGRHTIELTRRGYRATGIEISKDLVGIAEGEAEIKGVEAEFAVADLRELAYEAEFDVVLNLHDGAVGYFESDAENRRVFETIARALRPGGANLLQVPNLLYAEAHLPQRTWTLGKQALELVERHWSDQEHYVEGEIIPLYLDDIHFELDRLPFRRRLYSVAELREIYASLGMSLTAVFDAEGKPLELSAAEPEVFVVARKG